jgi:small subunit ribosomal protein S29
VVLAQGVQEVNQGLAGEGLGALTLKQVITGERSTGKSLLLLQAMSMAYLNNWIVLNVPEGMYSLMAALLTAILTCQI